MLALNQLCKGFDKVGIECGSMCKLRSDVANTINLWSLSSFYMAGVLEEVDFGQIKVVDCIS